MPVAYVELACRGQAATGTYKPLITDPAFQRREANTYLTYPEWHIVFAYDGLAQALKTGDEHAFDYLGSIAGFWSSTCALMRVAEPAWRRRLGHAEHDPHDRRELHGGDAGEGGLRRNNRPRHGVAARTAQDAAGQGRSPTMAADYAAFLRQTPWYQYPFKREAHELWAAPVEQSVRGWERRLGIGLEFEAKRVYAKVIARRVPPPRRRNWSSAASCRDSTRRRWRACPASR